MRNPLSEYRRLHREIRRAYDPFTSRVCPTCPEPCCVRPARVAPADILLAQAIGWAPAGLDAPNIDIAPEVAKRVVDAMSGIEDRAAGEPCDFLGADGCSFPRDLRPFGCTEYICRFMHADMDRASLSRLKRLIRDLGRAHQELMEIVHRRHGEDV